MTPSARRAVATLAAVLASILLPLSIAGTWVHDMVDDQDAYVATVGPLAHDAVVRAALVGVLDRQVTGSIVGQLPAGAGTVLQKQISGIVHTVVTATVRTTAFASAWKRLNRTAHHQVLAVLRNDPGAVRADGKIRVALDPLLRAALDPLGKALPAGLDVVPSTHVTFTLTSKHRLVQAQGGYRVLRRVAPVLPWVWIACVLIAVVVAPDRRRIWTTLGVGTIVGLLLLRALIALERHQVLARTSRPYRGLAGVVWDRVLHDPLHDILLGVIIAAVVLLARIVYGIAVPRRAPAV